MRPLVWTRRSGQRKLNCVTHCVILRSRLVIKKWWFRIRTGWSDPANRWMKMKMIEWRSNEQEEKNKYIKMNKIPILVDYGALFTIYYPKNVIKCQLFKEKIIITNYKFFVCLFVCKALWFSDRAFRPSHPFNLANTRIHKYIYKMRIDLNLLHYHFRAF